MAGGKETPRQRMIGMMYLVLTALLAMNVSTTVIDKFLFINASLEEANDGSKNGNSKTLAAITKKVSDGKSAEDRKFLDLANQLKAKVNEVDTYLQDLKGEFVTETGGYLDGKPEEYTFLRGKTDYDKVGNYMFPEQEGGQGYGDKLEKSLDDYVAFVKDIVKQAGGADTDLQIYKDIAQDAEESDIYKHDPNQIGKKFVQLAFENSPTPAALATVSEFQSKVLQYETAALAFLSGKVGGTNIEFNKIIPMVLPVSQYVAAGAKYEAQMFISASTSNKVEPVMTMDGKQLTVAGGKGNVSFTAQANNYDKNGIAEKSFSASISVKTRNGKDTTFNETIKYFVVRPVIQIQSDAVQALFLNCGNELDVQVPALGNAYNPSFSATGGSAIKGSKIGKVTLVPKTVKDFKLSVSNGGNLVGTRSFKVKRIPAPTIEAYVNGRAVSPKTGMSAKTPTMDLRAIPDESFQKFLPNDAKFRVTKGQVYLIRSGNSIRSIQISGPKINLASLAAQARKGDALVIEIDKVMRANYNNQLEDFNNIPQSSKYITIPLK